MITKTPEQDLSDTLYKASLDMGYDTYDYRPPKSEAVTYPFVEIGETMLVEGPVTSGTTATISIQLNIWGIAAKRKSVSDISGALFMYARSLDRTLTGRRLRINRQASSSRLTIDTSVPNTILVRGLLDLEFNLF